MNTSRHLQQGFTLIELMIVVAIIAIMSTMALPSFQDRVIKVQVGEGVALAEFVKQGVSSYYARNKHGNRANSHLAGKKLTLRPAVVEGYPAVPIAWVCGRASAPGKMKVLGGNSTDLPVPHLPLDCAS